MVTQNCSEPRDEHVAFGHVSGIDPETELMARHGLQQSATSQRVHMVTFQRAGLGQSPQTMVYLCQTESAMTN